MDVLFLKKIVEIFSAGLLLVMNSYQNFVFAPPEREVKVETLARKQVDQRQFIEELY